MRHLFRISLLLLALLGCDRPPSRNQIAADTSARLNQAFADTFEIAELRRRGSAKDVSAPAQEIRRIVYFDVSLRARRDLDLGTWDTPGAASLVSTLGAGPKGIYGVKSGGNQAGDIVRAHASAIYRREGEAWRPVAAAGFSAAPAPVTDNQAPRPVTETLMAALQGTIQSLPPGTTPRANAIIEDELSRAVNNIRARLAHNQEGYAIAAGPEQGQYLRFVRALATIGAAQKVRVVPLITAGSEENLLLLQEGSVLLALAQGDVAALAYKGEGPFAGTPNVSLRALGSLYLEPLHVLVRADSPIRAMRDLAGRRINVGPVGSGTRITAIRVLEAHGLTAARLGEPFDLALGPALAALRDGRIDAVMQIIGAPADDIRTAFTTLPLRLIPLELSAIESLARDSAYISAAIPRGTYPTLADGVSTIGVAAMLVATTHLTTGEVATIVRLVFTASDLVAAGSVQGAQVSARTAGLGLTIPMHEGAGPTLATIGAR